MTKPDGPAADPEDDPAELSPEIYNPAPVSSADFAHAERLLAHQGMIPLTDVAGHCAAVHLRREHCQHEKGHRSPHSRPLSTQILLRGQRSTPAEEFCPGRRISDGD